MRNPLLNFGFSILARPTQAKIDLLLKQGLTPEQVELCIAADPTEKDYVQWLARQLKKQTIKLPEDTEKLLGQLKQFSKLKNSPRFTGDKNIDKYDPSTLYDVVSQNKEEVSEKEKIRSLKEDGGQGAELIVNQPPYKIFKVTDPAALMELSSNTNWCTTQDNYAKMYLEKGPNYVFFKDGQPCAQLDPNSGSFCDPKDKRFPVSQIVQGIKYIEDDEFRGVVELLKAWFKKTKSTIPESLKPYLTSKEKAQKTLDKKIEKGTLTLAQRFELDKVKVQSAKEPFLLEGDASGITKLAEQYLPEAKFSDVLYFIKLFRHLPTKSRGWGSSKDKYQITYRVPPAEPYLLSKMTLKDYSQVMTYWKEWSTNQWPELVEKVLSLIGNDEKSQEILDSFVKSYYFSGRYKGNDYNPRIVLKLIEGTESYWGGPRLALAYYAWNEIKQRNPDIEKAIIENKDIYLMFEYYAGGQETVQLDHRGSYNSKKHVSIPPYIAPNRWPEFEKFLIESLENDKNNEMPAWIKKYQANCKEQVEWPNLEEEEFKKLAAYRTELEEELAKGENPHYSGSLRNYCTGLSRLLTSYISQDQENPKIDQELRWLRDFNNKWKTWCSEYNKKQTESYNKKDVKWDEQFLQRVKEYKSLAWDRRTSSRKGSMKNSLLNAKEAAVNVVAKIPEETKMGNLSEDGLKKFGLYVIEKAEVPEYELVLVGSKEDPDWFELAFQQKGQDSTNVESQSEKIPPKSIPRNQLKTVIQNWLQKYPKIHIMSYNSEHLRKYVELLDDMGFDVAKAPELVEGKPAFYVTAAIDMQETPQMLPPRPDMQRHVDQEEQNEIDEGIGKVKQEGVKIGSSLTPEQQQALDAAISALRALQNMNINPNISACADMTASDLQEFADYVGTSQEPAQEGIIPEEKKASDYEADSFDLQEEVEEEAREAFMQDPGMLEEAENTGVTMKELWKEYGRDWTLSWTRS